MNTSEALTTIAQVAITLLGFTGVVAVLGRRAHGDWTGHEITTFKTFSRRARRLCSSASCRVFSRWRWSLISLPGESQTPCSASFT